MKLKKDLRQIALKGVISGLCLVSGSAFAAAHTEHVMIASGGCGQGHCHDFVVDPAKVQHYGPDSNTDTNSPVNKKTDPKNSESNDSGDKKANSGS